GATTRAGCASAWRSRCHRRGRSSSLASHASRIATGGSATRGSSRSSRSSCAIRIFATEKPRSKPSKLARRDADRRAATPPRRPNAPTICAMLTDASTGPGRFDRAWAIAFARLVLGFIFFMAGVYKVFDLGALGHARKSFLPFQDTFLPVWSLWAVGVAIPFVELVAGGLLLIGWRVREALLALGAVLVIVT